MSPPSKKQLKKGAYGYGDNPEDADFLAVERSPWEASASGHGYNAKFSDDDGYERGEQDRSGHPNWQSRGADDAAFLKSSWEGDYYDAPHQRLAGLIDDSQPYDPLLPGALR